jgi:predicted nucleic acid-binding protein
VRAYFDTRVVIYLVQEVSPWYDKVVRVMDEFQPVVVTSDIVRMECLIHPIRLDNDDLASDFRAALAVYQHRLLDSPVFDRAAKLRAEHRFASLDAIHLTAAIEDGCDEFWTNDYRFGKATLPLTVRVSPRHEEPAPAASPT